MYLLYANHYTRFYESSKLSSQTLHYKDENSLQIYKLPSNQIQFDNLLKKPTVIILQAKKMF